MVRKDTFFGGVNMDFEGVLRDVMDKRGFAEAFYDEIRLVDPVSKAVLSHLGKGGEPADTGKRCYEFFDKPIACEHCISMLALQRNGQVVKIDCGLPRVYVTTAEPVEHEGGRFVVETLKNISDSGLVSIQGEEAVAMNKLLERRNSMLLKDALTKIYRENLIDLRLPQDLYQVKAGNRTLSLILVSIQNLKEINETQGLDAGDELLRQSAAVLNGFAGKPGAGSRALRAAKCCWPCLIWTRKRPGASARGSAAACAGCCLRTERRR